MLKVTDVAQMSTEWFTLKAGIPSASNFDKIITTKGAQSKSREKYMHELAAEKIMGEKMEHYTNDAMQRGIDLEAEARNLYEMLNDVKVEEVGFCFNGETKTAGCSPDGLVGEDGGLEIKCPLPKTHVGYLIDNKLPTDYFQQVQGSLYITGRKWYDFMSYCPGIKPLIIRITRDEKFIVALDFELKLFCNELKIVIDKIK